MEDLQKMMVVALVYRVLVCVYEVRLSTVSVGDDDPTAAHAHWEPSAYLDYGYFPAVVVFLLQRCVTSRR